MKIYLFYILQKWLKLHSDLVGLSQVRRSEETFVRAQQSAANMSTTQSRMGSPFSGALFSFDKWENPHIDLFRFDSPDSKVNSLGVESSEDLKACFEKFMADSSAKSAVLVSGKPGCFIAGADINMLASCKTAEEATALSKGCQDLLFEVEKSSKPVVAAIQGELLLVIYN